MLAYKKEMFNSQEWYLAKKRIILSHRAPRSPVGSDRSKSFNFFNVKIVSIPIWVYQSFWVRKGQLYPLLPPETFPLDILWRMSRERINLNLNAHTIYWTYIPINSLLCPKCQPNLFLLSPIRANLPHFTP